MLWDELVLRAFFDEQPAVHLPACPNCFVVRATLVPTVFSQFACTRTAGPGRTADRDTIRQSSRDVRENEMGEREREIERGTARKKQIANYR